MSDAFKVPRSINVCSHCGLDFRIFTTSEGAQLGVELARLHRVNEGLTALVGRWLSAAEGANLWGVSIAINDCIDDTNAALRSAIEKGEPT